MKKLAICVISNKLKVAKTTELHALPAIALAIPENPRRTNVAIRERARSAALRHMVVPAAMEESAPYSQ
ncbi:MAG: hypothetical protein ACI8T1_000799 [Verrucomicrobiales bacterium]|jgi:hypothetical protein